MSSINRVKPAESLELAIAGDDRSLARVISAVVDGEVSALAMLGKLYRRGGHAHVVGITGAPGAGKSTLVSSLVSSIVEMDQDRKIAVVAVDPSSPFSGGAILGDRTRMGDHARNPNVFIRSVSNRGHLGGIASTTPAVVTVLDGVGYDDVIIETVGIGQSEVEIASASETTVVVVNPGWGDAIQTAKAGFLEIADIFVVNKADRPEVNETVADLSAMLDIGPDLEWTPPIVSTVATTGQGIDQLVEMIKAHRLFLTESGTGAARREARARHALIGAIRQSVDDVLDHVESDVIDRLVHRSSDPWSEAAAILAVRPIP